MAPVALFSWTGCYAGGNVGGGWASKDVTDPVQLVQGFLPRTRLHGGRDHGGNERHRLHDRRPVRLRHAVFRQLGGRGGRHRLGGQHQRQHHLGAAAGQSGDTLKFTARADFISSATARLGYSFDRVLLYAKGGGAWVGDKYSAVGTFAGTGFDFEGNDLRTGWTAGAGAEWAVWDNWSVRLEYDYYDFGHRSVLTSDSTNVLSGPVDIKQTVQTIKLGLSFHVWSSGY